MRARWCLLACLLGCEAEPVIENTFPDQATSVTSQCAGDDNDTFFVVLWSGVTDDCRPENVDEQLILFAVEHWDHSAGTFTVGEETSSGTARVTATGDFTDEVTGTITIGEFDDTPTKFGWDLDIGSGGTELKCSEVIGGGC